MNRRYTALAMTAFAMGTVVLTTTEASAMLKDPGGGGMPASTSTYDWPDEATGYPGSATRSPEYNHPNYDPKYEPKYEPTYEPATAQTAARTSSNDDELEGLRLGAAALSGAGVAFGGMWLYRRRYAQAG